MLPPKLYSTYQRYKQDTDVVASWLASTALACGYSPELLKHHTTQTEPSSSGRLKGKARKEAKLAKQNNDSNNIRPKHIIAVAEFVPLAEFIALSKSPSASAPDSFIGALARVISLRHGFRDQMYAEGMTTSPESDEQHDYFVRTLEQVRTTLKPIMPTSQRGDLPVRNTFESLKLYEPSQSFLDAPAPPKADHSKPLASNTYEAEQSTAFDELSFAWSIMIKDLTNLRERIVYIWNNHRCDSMDTAAAALATNTAIDLARSIMDEVMPLTIPHGGIWHVARAMSISECLAHGIHPNVDDDDCHDQAYVITQRNFLWAHRLLESFVEVLDQGPLPIFESEKFGVYDPHSDRRNKTTKEKAEEDTILLMQLFAEQMTLIRVTHDYPVEDEFLRGMKELDRTREVPFYLAFAAQVHVDIHHMLRMHASEPSQILLQALRVYDEEITAFMEFHKSLKSSSWPATNDKFLLSVQEQIRWIRSDPIHRGKAQALKGMGRSIDPDLRPHLLLSWSPVVSGLILFRYRALH